MFFSLPIWSSICPRDKSVRYPEISYNRCNVLFNFHVDAPSDRDAQRFLRLLETFNLKQHINVPTHRSGHTLDLVITRSDENVASKFDVYDPSISDHFVVSCMLSLPKTSFERKEICCRKLKSIDMQTFRDEISNSALASPSSIVDDLEQLTAVYDLTLSSLVDKHAPLKTRIVTVRPSASWYNENIMTEKRKRRKLERRWRRTGLAEDRVRFIDQCRVVNKCVEKARMDYYSGVIAENQSDPKRLFATFDSSIGQMDRPILFIYANRLKGIKTGF